MYKDLHFLRNGLSAAFSEMVNAVVNTVYHAASVIRRSAKVMILRGSHQAPVKVENSFCIIVFRNALRRFGMEEPFFVEITFFLPEQRPTGRFSESAEPRGTDAFDVHHFNSRRSAGTLSPVGGNQVSCQFLAKGGSLEFLIKARKIGLTRFIGMSVHPPFSTSLRLLEQCNEWDVIQPFLNCVLAARQRMFADKGTSMHAVNDQRPGAERRRTDRSPCSGPIGGIR